MRWSRHRGGFLAITLIAALVLFSTLLLFPAGEEKRITIYSPAANYSLTVVQRAGQDYVGLMEILEPQGAVSVNTEKPPRWKLRFKNVEGEFRAGQARARVGGHDIDLPGNFLLESGRGLVPLSALNTLLPRFLGAPIVIHENSRRLFIGNVAVHFTAKVNSANALVMDFSSPVNPMIATEPGKLRMVFTREPVVPPGTQTLTFDNKIISSANYQEDNGAAEVIVNGSVSLLASFSNDGRTITIAPVTQGVSQGAPVAPAPGLNLPVVPAPPPAGTATPEAGGGGPVAYFAVVDASHGGDERGAALSDQLAEKVVTLEFARRLRHELETRGIRTLVLRDGDATLSLDQRVSLTNSVHPAIYLCVHATSQGNGVNVYTALLPAGGDSHGPFLDFDTAQAGSRELSQAAQLSVVTELRKKQIPVRSLSAPQRPLNNIPAAAIAIEIAPPAGGISGLNTTEYQTPIAEAVAAAVVAVRDRLGARR